MKFVQIMNSKSKKLTTHLVLFQFAINYFYDV